MKISVDGRSQRDVGNTEIFLIRRTTVPFLDETFLRSLYRSSLIHSDLRRSPSKSHYVTYLNISYFISDFPLQLLRFWIISRNGNVNGIEWRGAVEIMAYHSSILIHKSETLLRVDSSTTRQ